MEFKKQGNRFLLSPRDRVILLLKKYKEMPMSNISRLANVQYDSLHRLIDKMSQEGLVVVITTSFTNYQNKEIIANKKVIWKNKK